MTAGLRILTKAKRAPLGSIACDPEVNDDNTGGNYIVL